MTREGPSTATIFRVVFTAAAALLLLYALYRVRSILILVFVAGFLAVGLDPAVRRLEGWNMRRGVAVSLIFLGVFVFIAGFVAAVIPPLVEQIGRFATDLPDYVQNLAEKNPRIERFVEENELADKLRDATGSVPTAIGGSLGRVLGLAGSFVGAIFSSVTVIVLMIYFSLSLSRLHEGSLKLIPSSRRERVRELADPILEKIGGYIAGNVVVSLIAGATAFIFLIIAGVPFPVALALWVAIADLIPLVGATLGAIPAVVVAFSTSLPVGIATLIYFIVYQQAENYLIAPRVMKKAVDISPAAVLLAALIGGGLLGFVGAMLAIPAAAAVKLIAQEVIVPRMQKT